MRMEELRKHEGIAAGRYVARLSLDRNVLKGAAGSRITCLLTVENHSPSPWRTDEGRRYSISLRLRSHTGRVLQDLRGMASCGAKARSSAGEAPQALPEKVVGGHRDDGVRMN